MSDIILLPGLWLRSDVWTPVADELRRLGDRPVCPALPGVDDEDAAATLDDQLAAVVAVVDAAERPLVVGHSAAATLAWLAADRRPEAVAKVALVGGFPETDGETYAAFFEIADGVMAFPGWQPFAGADSADLDEETKEAIEMAAVPVPEGVSHAAVRLGDERRFDVPVLLVCPEYSPDEAREWLAAGDVPELSQARRVEFADVNSGHWPMFTQATELARILHEAG